jgi:hypothetical protein
MYDTVYTRFTVVKTINIDKNLFRVKKQINNKNLFVNQIEIISTTYSYVNWV